MSTSTPTLQPSSLTGPQLPPVLQLLQWIGRPVDFLESCSDRYGDLFLVQLGKFLPGVFISDPEAIRAVLKLDAKAFDSGRSNGILKPLVGSESILLLDGDRHQRQRQLLMPPFHGERMLAYGQLMREIALQVGQRWEIGQAFSLRSAMQEIALRVILKAVFGLGEGDRAQSIGRLLSSILDMTGAPLSSSLLFLRWLQQDWGAWSPWGRFLRQREQLDQLLYAEIHHRRENFDPTRTDILTLMMLARDEAGNPMTNVELRDELMTLLLAGHETTASALTWAMYWIHHVPQVLEKVLAELDSLSDPTDSMAIARLPYLNAVCQETLRIYPVALIAFPRLTKAPFDLMGHIIQPDMALIPCVYLLHHRPDLYPNPKQFKPERFLERQYSPYEYLPFGGGNRRCIGMAFAQFEMKLVLATVLSQFRLGLVNPGPVKPVRRGVTLAPPSSLKMKVLEPR